MTDETTTPGAKVRDLMRRAEAVTLSTALARDGSGWPYGSLVLVALAHDASPVLLLSDLADHTRNIAGDSRVCLLFDGTTAWRDRLAGPRASVLGRIAKCRDPRLGARFVARHPQADGYSGFSDFNFYKVEIESAHLVAGFGEIHWIEPEDVRLDCAGLGALAGVEADIVDHMNEDHGDALDLMARHLLGRDDAGWCMTGIDPEGCDLRCETQLARLGFEQPVADAPAARAALVRLKKRARARQTAGHADGAGGNDTV